TVVESLADETDAGQALRRASVAPPEPTVLAVEGVIGFAGLGVPRAHAALGPPHLDDAEPRRMMRNLPIKAVAAHIHETPAAPQISFERVEHVSAVVFGMTAGQHDLVRRQEVEPLAVQVLLGDDVVIAAELFQPIDDEEI